VKDLRDMLPYMDADVTMFNDYSVNHSLGGVALASSVADVIMSCVQFVSVIVFVVVFITWVCSVAL